MESSTDLPLSSLVNRKPESTISASCSSTLTKNVRSRSRKPRQTQKQSHCPCDCTLDSKNCLSLENILESFSVISEEQAWALCYQCAKYGKSIFDDPHQRHHCLLVSDTKHLKIHLDGQVHPDTFITVPVPLSPSSSSSSISVSLPPRSTGLSEGKIISNLAAVIFHALDFGLAEDQERHLSSELESLIEEMALAGDFECDYVSTNKLDKIKSKDSSIHSERLMAIASASGDTDNDNDKDNEEEEPKNSPLVTFDRIIEICTNRLKLSPSRGDSSDSESFPDNSNNNRNVFKISDNIKNNNTGAYRTKSKLDELNLFSESETSDTNNDRQSISVIADEHYTSVCRSMVSEVLSLSSFLRIVSQDKYLKAASNSNPRHDLSHNSSPSSTSRLSDKDKDSHVIRNYSHLSPTVSLAIRKKEYELNRDSDGGKYNFVMWAQGWFQVMGELRTSGIKLKKVTTACAHHHSRNKPLRRYELSPFEVLLNDIRGRRYNLKKVKSHGSGSPPRTRAKDAHSIILEFIRSRPTLKKMEDRVLGPPPKKNPAPREILMDEIRMKPSLKPVSPRAQGPSPSSPSSPPTCRSSSRKNNSYKEENEKEKTGKHDDGN